MALSPVPRSTSYAPDGPDALGVLGRTEPRLWTPPLRSLTPDTSVGFDWVDFARDVVRRPFDPWQEWLAIHAGELLPDGRPRFRTVLVLVARQNGKTEVPVLLANYWMFVDAAPMILGTSTKLDYAKESWTKTVRLAESAPDDAGLAALRPARWKREANGEQECWTSEGSRYKIAASNAEGGRSLTLHRLICDELRQHHDYTAWDAAVPAGNAVRDFQTWCLSNAGDDRSIVLNDLREAALKYIQTGQGDRRLGLFEWSAPDDADPEDIEALAQANPNLNRRIDGEALLDAARRAVAAGGAALTGFKTESMCIRVRMLDPAIDLGAWRARLQPGGLDDVRNRVAMCLDIAPDGAHATLYAAAVLDDDRVRVDYVHAWDSTRKLRAELPELLQRVKPRVLGWLPGGPAAALAADLADRGQPGWPPRGIKIAEIKSDLPPVCMGFADQVATGRLLHSGDPLLDAQVELARRLARGDQWVFSRRDGGHVDAVYAAAGAAWLARTLPRRVKPAVLVSRT